MSGPNSVVMHATPAAFKLDPNSDKTLIALIGQWQMHWEQWGELLRKDGGDDDAPSVQYYERHIAPLHRQIDLTAPFTVEGISAKAAHICIRYDGSYLPERQFLQQLAELGQ